MEDATPYMEGFVTYSRVQRSGEHHSHALGEALRAAISLERERCARIAEERMRVTANVERESCRLIAQSIREQPEP